jgi:hypothetical protein
MNLGWKHAPYGWHTCYISLACTPICLWTYIFRKACYLGCWCLRYGMIALFCPKYLESLSWKENNDLASSSMLCLRPIKAIYWSYWKTDTHMLLFILLSFAKLFWPLWNILYMSVIKITDTTLPHTRLLHWKLLISHPSINQIKLHMCCDLSL